MKSQVVRMSLAVAALVLPGRGISATPCDTQYRHLQAVISDAHLPEPFHRHIALRIDAGWLDYASGVDSLRASASTDLGDASSTVASSELKSLVPDDVRTAVAAALDQLKACVNASGLGSTRSNAAGLEFSPVSNGVLPSDFREATLRFVDDRGQLVRMKRIRWIELHSQNDVALNVTSMFTVTPDGVLRLSGLTDFLAAIAGRLYPSQLSVEAFDANGASYRGTTSPFAIGRYSVRVQLVSPAGTPAKLDSAFVRVTNDRTGTSFWSKTASDGTATFTHMPAGRYQFASDVVRTPDRLFARGSFQLDRDNASVPAQLSAREDQSAKALVREPWHAPGETDPHKVLEVSFRLTPEGTLKPGGAWEHDSWKILDSLSEEELKARVQRESVSDLDPDSRTIAVRVVDPRGQVLFRTPAILHFVSVTAHARNRVNPYAIVTLPAEIRGRMETEAVDARWDISLDIAAIRSEFLR